MILFKDRRFDKVIREHSAKKTKTIFNNQNFDTKIFQKLNQKYKSQRDTSISLKQRLDKKSAVEKTLHYLLFTLFLSFHKSLIAKKKNA